MSSVSSSTSSASSKLRITGMSSGLDVDSTVKQLMSAYNTKLDKMKQDRQIVQWRQDLYKDIISDTKTFASTYFDQLNRDNYMLSSKTYAGFDITATDNLTSSSNNVSVTATGGVSAVAGQYLVKVDKLAEAATLSVSPGADGSKTYTKSTKLTDLDAAYGGGPVSLTLDYNSTTGKTITLDNSSGAKTVGDLVAAINSQTGGKVVASISELTGKLTIKTSTTGVNTSIAVTGASGNLISDLLGTNVSDVGQDADVWIAPPGVSIANATHVTTKSSNSFTVDGVTFDLKKVNDSTNANDYSRINLTTNTDGTFDKIKGFIDKYNELVDKIKTKVEEKRNLSYPPLTDAQKESMTEDQITKWEAKAKAGILKNDSSLDAMLTSMRKAFYDKVSEAGITLSEAGLSTSDDSTQRGKIFLTRDSTGEYKLKNALKNHGTELVQLFTKESTTGYDVDNDAATRKTRYQESGIFQRVNDIIKDYTTTSMAKNGQRGILIDKAGTTSYDTKSSIYKDLAIRDKAITEMKSKLVDKENSLYKKFSALETYMNKMNSQSSWLNKQFG